MKYKMLLEKHPTVTLAIMRYFHLFRWRNVTDIVSSLFKKILLYIDNHSVVYGNHKQAVKSKTSLK